MSNNPEDPNIQLDDKDPRKILEVNKRKRGRPKGSKNQGGPKKLEKKAKERATRELWKKGIIHWKLDSNQLDLYHAYHNRDHTELIALWSRQIGKSYTASVIIIEECIKRPNLRVAYVSPLQKQTMTIVRKNFNFILQDCPSNIRPKFNTQTKIWTFPNGSEITCIGTDNNNVENVRGDTFDILVIDEAGFINGGEYDYAMKSVLKPTLTNAVNPVTIYVSTPPKTMGHPFNRYIDKAELEGNLIKRTIYDCPRLSPVRVQQIVDEYGGKDSIDFRREYLCERIADTTLLVIPEATTEKIEELTAEWTRPPYFDTYVSGDFGAKDDWSAFLFMYYDFRNAKLIIEDELIFNKIEVTTDEMANKIKAKELKLWRFNDMEDDYRKPEIRVCDNEPQIIIDFQRLHQLTFLAASKDNKQAAINEVRMKVAGLQIVIHPRCKHLLSHIQNAMWNKQKTTYEKGIDGSHFDALDALIYGVRHINWTKNPYPANWDVPSGYFFSPKQNQQLTPFQEAMNKAFQVKKRRK